VLLVLSAGWLACHGSAGPTGPPPETPPATDASSSPRPTPPAPAADASSAASPPVASDAATPAPPPASDGGAATAVPADAASPPAGGVLAQVVVSAGDLDRQNTVVSFMLDPALAAGRALVLRDSQGKTLDVQVDDSGRAVFVLPALKAGAQATFALAAAAAPPPAQVKATREADGVKLGIGASTALRYQMQGKLPPGIEPWYLRGGYLHPIFTPSGVLVTDDYTRDHHAHHGLWSAWAPVTFEGKDINFWAMGERTGKGDFDALLGTWDGPVHAGLRARNVQVSLAGAQPKTALNEIWVVTLYRTHEGPAPYFLFDLDSTQETATTSAVMIHEHIYGGFALRGHAQWGASADFLTSEGRTRANGDGTNGRWCHIGGRVDGKQAGYAALGHPGNFRAPQPLRINPSDPFFSLAPAAAGPFAIVPGKPYVSHFRVVVSDGPADRALLDRLWNDYARPPEVAVRPGGAP
jgi:hypothetical protein